MTTTGAAAPAVGLDDQAQAVIGWTVSGIDGWLRGLNPDGSFTGRLGAQTFTNTTTGRQDKFVVAVSPWGEVPVAYTDGNRFDQICSVSAPPTPPKRATAPPGAIRTGSRPPRSPHPVLAPRSGVERHPVRARP
ncbi:hypothetical protein AB0J83_22150 [Actinoplanes sp. NPDC049596]|uniref:hypothetical protein n=1 Tax=unclassified Actinoplanes TaxID=2626549 RepID=UPI00343F1024